MLYDLKVDQPAASNGTPNLALRPSEKGFFLTKVATIPLCVGHPLTAGAGPARSRGFIHCNNTLGCRERETANLLANSFAEKGHMML